MLNDVKKILNIKNLAKNVLKTNVKFVTKLSNLTLQLKTRKQRRIKYNNKYINEQLDCQNYVFEKKIFIKNRIAQHAAE